MLAGSFLERSYRNAVDRLLVRPLAARKVPPDWVTAAGLFLSTLAALLVPWSPPTAGLVLLAAGVFDTVDGALSRATGQASPAGALLDSTFDRYAEFATLVGAWARLSRLGNCVGGGALALVALQGSVMVSYARARAEGLGFELRGGVFERTERVLVLAAGLLTSPLEGRLGLPEGACLIAALAVLAVGSNTTAVARILRARRALRSRDSA
jgi:CDP-diacylglycerol--glycerol-3-phosphate 3-phosphatidyltransferase